MTKKKTKVERSEQSIPQEIIFEIFSWLPVKSLIRLKCVSVFCNSVLSEQDFKDIHRRRSMTRKKFFLHERESVFYCADQKKDGKDTAAFLQIERYNKLYHLASRSCYLNCVNGLFCIWGSLPAAIFNPSTREIRFLPNLSGSFSAHYYSLGFETEENKYKVLLTTNGRQRQKHWVLTLGIDESWRETKTSLYFMSKPGICISGFIYKFIFHGEHRGGIGVFDVKTESFKVTSLWASHMQYCELTEVKGQLAVIDYEKCRHGYVHLRVLEEEWMSYYISLPLMWKRIQPKDISSCTTGDGEIVFVMNFYSDILCWCYDVARKRWRKLELKGLPSKSSYIKGIYSYVERLVI